MILKRIDVDLNKPGAFKGIEEIEYVHLIFEDFKFTCWGHSNYTTCFQIKKGFRDLSMLLDFIFTEYLPIGRTYKFSVSIPDNIIKNTDWELNGGTYRNNESNDFVSWTKMEYRKYLKSLNI